MFLDEKFRELLVKSGLSEVEAEIYVMLLAEPVDSKWAIVEKTNFGKSKVYRAFDKLEEIGLIKVKPGKIKAVSLRNLIDYLRSDARKMHKLADKLQKISPYLQLPIESFENFKELNDIDSILETYLFMAEHDYNTCLDFGDLEGFVNILPDFNAVLKFRKMRAKHAKNRAICTTSGPYTSYMARTEDLNRFKATLKRANFSFKDKWLIFSDNADYLMISDFSEANKPSAVLIKSKAVADAQRAQFHNFSQLCEN